MEFLLQYSRFIIEGFITALTMTIIGVSGGAVLGITTALLDVYGGRVSKVLVGIYVEFFRGSPLIVQLLIFYFSIPAVTGLNWDAYTAGAVTLILNSGAYQKGYFKGAIEAVFKDQLMAAASIGLTFRQTLRYIVLPQALKIVIPAWTNELVSLGLSTSALIIIGVRELTSIAKTIAAQTFRPLEVYFTIAIIYFIWITIMLKIMDIVYRRVRIPGLEVSI
ncbi:amino acid ABC transporter permease [Candidatus Geothermarchaeota archaeon]|nr:MAG: amino acid ABC transporter permease [Candidatus Geothermarchaeota archaeon]HEW93779.1 amino acid ABC transporter permease [Thermoprotei archaeon]